IEAALLDGRIDIAIHSAKDVPTEEDPRLAIAAYLPRADARDALVIGRGIELQDDAPPSLASLPAGARVGTDSPRRTAFLRAARPDLTIHSLHGNVDTRLRRLDAGETDALVLAAAGLDRLGLADRIACRFAARSIPPAPGQGALAIQTRTGDGPTRALVGHLDDPGTRRTVELERAILARSGGGCRAPLGVLAVGDAEGITVSAGYARLAGDLAVHATRRSVAATDDGLAAAVLADLAGRAIHAAMAGDGPRVIVTRETERAAATALALVDRGLAPIVVPCIAVTVEANQDLDLALGGLADRPTADWIVLTSVNAVRAVRTAADRLGLDLSIVPGPRWAAIGRATAAAMREAGIRVDEQPPHADGRSLAASLPIEPGSRVLLPRGDLADDVLPLALAERGAAVTSIVVYRTLEAPGNSAPLLGAALDERPHAIVATSGSTVRGLLALGRAIGVEDRIRVIPLIAIGPGTAAEAVRLGFDVAGHAAMQGPGGIADAVAAAVA
ncbi:MAG: hydroxymethylbilane synthase, partial [Chloroflexi bacterium]|nr:hydroxymethylbilane synthase [Chloroflexota bacterium]